MEITSIQGTHHSKYSSLLLHLMMETDPASETLSFFPTVELKL
jgi:hypothetical protein